MEQAVKLLKTEILKLPWLQQSVHMSIDFVLLLGSLYILCLNGL